MKKLAIASAVILFGFSAFAQNTKSHFDNYINVKTSLVNSDTKAASTAINVFYEAVKSDGNFGLKADLLKETEKLSKASSIEKQRDAFSDVSEVMWKLVKNSDKINQDVYYQYCPMKKAYWLSNEKAIKNPYYGSSMLSCGKVAETKR